LILTSAGIYAVVAYTTTLRAREMGIRVALGATPAKVVGAVLRGALAPLAAGLATGLVASLLMSRLLVSLLYEISGTDPVTYLGAGALLFAIGALASVRPAWRAAVGDPLQALRI
jgi:ABC-type antimicrobial peptide transport system permease subunit